MKILKKAVTTQLNAIGSSSARPIATNEASSTVLFQTYRNISPSGRTDEAYGWLVVSAVYDIWDERIALKGDNRNPKNQEELEDYRKGKVNLTLNFRIKIMQLLKHL